MNDALPVTVIGGYLGAGKTTLVNHLLRHANGLRLAVLVNEFGELAIDEDLIEAEDDDIISIAGGCVCCSFGNDLTGALMKMAKLDPRPDHLLIESSGVAIPSAIVGSVSLLTGYRIDGIVTLADAETVMQSGADRYMGDTVLRQLRDANIIVLNKVDLVSTQHLLEAEAWLNGVTNGARIIQTSQSAAAPEAVLDSFLSHESSTRHHHDLSALKMTSLPFGRPVDPEAVAQKLADPAIGLIRAKGFVDALSGQKTLVQVVGNRWTVSDADPDKPNGVVCLGLENAVSCAEQAFEGVTKAPM